jgi:outer membrane protein TolC
MHFDKRVIAVLVLSSLNGCVLAPRGTTDEQAKLRGAGATFEPPIEQRSLPELPTPATWRDVLHRAFLANGELESAYFEWKASLTRIAQVANYPNTNLAPNFSYMFSGENLKAWDRTTISAGFDPMENLSFPTKVAQAGKIALDQARAAGEKFKATKFELQRNVLSDYLELALMEEKIRIQHDNVELLKMLVDSAQSRVQAGGNQTDLLRAQTEHRLAENELATMTSERHAMQARLNGMLVRDPNAELQIPTELPAARPIAVDDASLIAVAVDQNPELAKLARDVEGRADAIELAKMQFIPDINPAVAFTGGVSQVIGAMVILPTTIPEIRGKIDESRAMLRADQAMLRQTRSERAANFVAALYVLRNSERQVQVFEETILPRAQQVLASTRQNYSTGAGMFLDLIEGQRTVLEVRQMIAEARITREKQLAELEALAGVDIETLAPPTSGPTTQETQP